MTAHRIVFIQHGDYADAVERFAKGGDETYASQRYSVDLVAELAQSATVSVLCLPAPKGKHKLENGVTSIGLGWGKQRHHAQILGLLERLKPTALILRTPLPAVLAWALARRVRVLPLLADSFDEKSRERISTRLFISLCNSEKVEIVANHNRAASRALVELGVRASKVVPWDWPQKRRPDDLPPKECCSARDPQVFYAGNLSEEKGVSDLIRAVSSVALRGTRLRLLVAGGGNVEFMKRVASEVGVEAQVEFLGLIANTQVFSLMRESDVVVVPSRHSYPEGLPIVITEALCSRTPLLLSDHPVFVQTFGVDTGMRYFKAGDAENLADHLAAIIGSDEVYRGLSTNAQAAWERSQVSLTWGQLVSQWLAGDPADLAALRTHSMAARPGG